MSVDILSDCKTLLNINDTDISKNSIINIYIRRAVPLIQNYLQLRATDLVVTNFDGTTTTTPPVDVQATYPDAIIEYVIEQYKRRGNIGMKQFSEGSRSGTYDNSLSDAVKALLPQPYVRLQSSGREGYDYGY
ncbi:MAG: phage head-tail connector protein [Clostridium sp.]|uniref:phage head-tail connector protein n=1 Tax=Clostridium sp. TaxID=1506 RepID=UPI0039EC534F